MRSPTSAILIFTLCAAVVIALASLSYGGEERIPDAETYQINYHLNGGQLPEGTGYTYVSGSYMPLPYPHRDGFYFAGWCTEPAMTNPIGGIIPTLRGHITLYAKWIEDDREGLGWNTVISGSYYNGELLHNVSGNASYGFEKSIDGYTLLSKKSSMTYSWSDGSVKNDSESSEWIRTMTEGWHYTGNIVMNGSKVTIWQLENSTMWVRDMEIPLKIETVANKGMIVETITDIFRFDPETTFSPNVSFDYPLTVAGIPNKLNLGEPMTLTANGDGFEGWYINGKKVSENRTHTFLLPAPGDVIFAHTVEDYTIVNDISEIKIPGLKNLIATSQDGNTHQITSKLDPGLYKVIRKDGNGTMVVRFLIEGYQDFSVRWEFDNSIYTYDRPIPFSEMFACEYEHPLLPRFAQRSQEQVESFCDGSSEYLKSLARTLLYLGQNMTEAKFPMFVLSFVQSIPYVEDIDSRGVDEYWKFPLETLWDGGGDCEDKTFLYATLMGLCGQKTAFLLFKDHTMPALEGAMQGHHMTIDGYRYVLCETTNIGFEIGQTTKGHLPSDALFVCRIESIVPLTTS